MTSHRSALLLTISSLALLAAAPAAAQVVTDPDAPTPEAAAAPTDPSPAPDSTIVVTGTRRTDRTVAESPVPVDIIAPTS
ncbi:hypothetical protein [Sphingomonas sp. LHG3443-2]|uniref:hypothetical protein n=1 Tax=Sphingomonas sp. LHG3443-2 TaxID=2804639 RepID=UPI003CF2273B